MAYNYFENLGEERNRNIPEEHRRRVQVQINVRFRLRDELDPFDISVVECMRLYRLSQRLMFELVELIRPYMPVYVRAGHVNLHRRVLCALFFYAQGSYQRGMGGQSYLSVSQKSMSVFIEEVTTALNHPDILQRLIHFPDTRAEWEHEIAKNADLNLPRVLGFIDGTLVKVAPPIRDENRRAYMCRKGYYALNVQVVCTSDLYIFDVNARFPGSANDPYIYSVSGVRDVMRRAFEDSRCWLLGDSIYPLEPWLHIPFPAAEEGTPEFYYTKAHCKDRNRVERCMGVLKERWRCVLWDRTLHYTPRKAGLVVNACVVLHNFCRIRNVPDPPVNRRVQVAEVEEPYDIEEDFPQGEGAGILRQQALQVQRYLIDHVARRRAAQED